MQMVAHHRVAADLDAEEPGQLAQPIKNPLFSVTVILPGIRVHAAEKSPADASCDAVVNADPFFVDDLAARAGRHGRKPGAAPSVAPRYRLTRLVVLTVGVSKFQTVGVSEFPDCGCLGVSR